MTMSRTRSLDKYALLKAIALSGAVTALAGCESFRPLSKQEADSGAYAISSFDAPVTPPQNGQFVDGHGQFTPHF